MAKHRTSPEATPILQLLSDYSFDVEAYGTEAMVTDWLQRFEPVWVSQAITEALYQGRYKVVSVDHILQFWQRRGQPLRHFNREFESIILGQSLSQIPSPAKESPAPLNFSQGQNWAEDNSPAKDTPPPTEFHSTEAHDAPDDNPEISWMTPSWASEFFASPLAAAPLDSWSEVPPELPPDSLTDSWPQSPAQSLTQSPVQSATDATTESPADDLTNAATESATDATEIASHSWPSARSIPPLTPDQLARLLQPLVPVAPSPIDSASQAEPNPVDQVLVDPVPVDHLSTETLEEDPAEAATQAEPADRPSDRAPEIPSNREPIPNFQPITSRWGFPSESADAIPPFVPEPGRSDLHQRLKAVVEAGLTEN